MNCSITNQTKENCTNDENVFSLQSISSNINLFLITIGILNNLICVYVFSHRIMRKHKFNLYLLLTAIFQIIYCLVLFVDYLFYVLKKGLFLHDLNVYIEMIIHYLIHLVDSYVIILSLIISIDRLYAI